MTNLLAQDLQTAWDLYYSYENFREKSITNRRFKHSDIQPLIERLKDNKIFTVNKVGESAEGKSLSLIKLGNGKTKVFLWSQMHGDEPTATAALFDIFNFFADKNSFAELKNFILNNVTIYALPMVNPDGAEIFQRRNIFDIDLNRDAVRQQTPEAIVLKNVFDSLKAEFGFNLHEQSREYTAGISTNPAAISFLAPVPDYDKTITPVRERSMKLIGYLFNLLNGFIPGHIAKYSDDFEPRAFGDNFTKWGTSTVLVESGGWRGDRERQFQRKINYLILLMSFKSIAEQSYDQIPLNVYESIPSNEKLMMDILYRNLKISNGDKEYLVDIGINFEEKDFDNHNKFYLSGSIEDLGDLSVFSGYDDFDFSGYTIEPGKTYPTTINNPAEIEKLDYINLLSRGFTNVRLNATDYNSDFPGIPLNIILNGNNGIDDSIHVGGSPNFILKKDGNIRFLVVNGFLFDPEHPESFKGNSILVK